MISAKRSNKTLNGTMIEDGNGTIHDLAELVTQRCVIDTGVTTYMAVQGHFSSHKFWIANNGNELTPWELARFIRNHPSHKNAVITVHVF